MIQARCNYCGRTVEIYPSRIPKFKYCSHHCRASAPRRKKREVPSKQCGMCGKVFHPSPRYSTRTWENMRFCSKSCAGTYYAAANSDKMVARLKERRNEASEDTLEEISKKIRQITLERNRTEILETACECCGAPIFYMKTPKGWIKEVDSVGNPKGNRGYLSSPPKFCSLSCGTTFRNLTSNPMNNPDTRAKHSRRMIEFYEKHPLLHPNYLARSRCKGSSSLQRKVCEVLEKLSIEHTHQYHVGRYWVDFAIPKCRLLIECDGEYLHRDKGLDARRDLAILLAMPGWKMVHFSEKLVLWLYSRRNELSYDMFIPALGVVNIEN